MKTYSAREIIRKAYGDSKNFMTPHVISVGKINQNTAYELSWGTGFTHSKIYGVSIAKVIKGGKGQRSYDLSKSFDSKSQALNYINSLKG